MLSPVRFNWVYVQLLHELLCSTSEEVNERTGVKIKVLQGGQSFKLDLSDGMLDVLGTRKLWPHVGAAEAAWFLSGERDLSWFQKYSKAWDKFVEEDTSPPIVANAYGYRYRNHFGRDQIQGAIDSLRKNPTNRRVMVCAWDPSADGFDVPSKNVPCPTNFTLSVVGGRLHSAYFLRSSDVFVGLPYDVFTHTVLMSAIAESLGLPLGTLHITMAHPHLYESHWEMARGVVNEWDSLGPQGRAALERYELPMWSVEDILEDKDAFVQQVRAAAVTMDWPSFNPRPDVIA